MTELNNQRPAVSNEVLAERVIQIKADFESFKRETRAEIKELEQEVEHTRRVAASVDMSMNYVKETVGKMEGMLSSFIAVVDAQNAKIDDFINSDKRRDSKKEFVVSVLQVVSGIVIALIGFWASGKI